MVGWAKIESLTVECDSFLKIFHLSQLLKACGNSVGKAIEACRATWMACRRKNESFMVARDSFLEILHLSHMLKAGENVVGEVAEG